VLFGTVLSFAALVAVCNAALYVRRACSLRTAAACDVPERLGLFDAAAGFINECVASAAAVLLIPIGWCMRARRTGTGARGPLVLVHGARMNRGSFWLLRRRALRDGWSPVWCFNYGPFGTTIETAAPRLRAVVGALATEHPTVTLIGHGRGGLVLRYYLRRFPAPTVRRVVLLGTRHAIGNKQDSDTGLLSTLNAADRVPQQFDVIAIQSTFDALVVPPATGRYPGAFNIEVNNVGHYALLFSARVYRLIAENLTAPPR